MFTSIGDTIISLVALSITDQLLFMHLVRHVGTCFDGVNERLRTLSEGEFRAGKTGKSGANSEEVRSKQRTPPVTAGADIRVVYGTGQKLSLFCRV